MEEQLVSFETAKLAKEKGFDLKIENNYFAKSEFPAPTQSLLQKWLRENYQLHITIYSSSQESWMYRITRPHQDFDEGLYDEDFENYEECLEHALQETLKLI